MPEVSLVINRFKYEVFLISISDRDHSFGAFVTP